jgi:hypothetical protein
MVVTGGMGIRRVQMAGGTSLHLVQPPAVPQTSAEDYAFRVRRIGALTVRVTGGNAYMVNEPEEAIATEDIAVPETDGTYVVMIRHTYGTGGSDGTWGGLVVPALADVPSEYEDGYLVARNFRIATLTVVSGALSGKPVQNWRLGDVFGYAPRLPPRPA